jgi:hypothetical protein
VDTGNVSVSRACSDEMSCCATRVRGVIPRCVAFLGADWGLVGVLGVVFTSTIHVHARRREGFVYYFLTLFRSFRGGCRGDGDGVVAGETRTMNDECDIVRRQVFKGR